MAYLDGKLIRSIHPSNGSIDVDLNTPIKILFSTYMNTDTIHEGTIRLLDDNATIVPITVQMDQEDPKRLAIATPQSSLNPSTRYQVIVGGGENGVRTVDLRGDGGNVLYRDYNWNFTTGKNLPLEKPVLISPSNQSYVDIQNLSFIWSPVEGAAKYEIEISGNKDFSTLIFNEQAIHFTNYVPDTTIKDNISLPGHLYWRIRGIDEANNPGSWSQVYQVYVSDIEKEQISYEDNDFAILEVVSTFPSVGSAEVDENIEFICIEFNSEINPDSVTEDNFYVRCKKVDGIESFKKIGGTTEVANKKIIFSPEEILSGHEYEVLLGDSIETTSAVPLGESYVFNFVTRLSPYYSLVEILRDEQGKYIESFSDIEISKIIYRVSKWADQIANKPYGEVNDHLYGENQSSTTNEIFYHEYVKYESQIRLLMRKTMEHALERGSQKSIGDLSIQKSGSMVPDINVVIKRLEMLRDQAEKQLTSGSGTKASPASAVLGSQGDPYRTTRTTF